MDTLDIEHVYISAGVWTSTLQRGHILEYLSGLYLVLEKELVITRLK